MALSNHREKVQNPIKRTQYNTKKYSAGEDVLSKQISIWAIPCRKFPTADALQDFPYGIFPTGGSYGKFNGTHSFNKIT
jgi:hypothetical protein